MAQIILGWKSAAKGPLARAQRITMEAASGGAGSGFSIPASTEPSAVSFEDASTDGIDNRKLAAYCWARMKECQERKVPDLAGVTFWQERYLKTEKVIREAELHERKMGVSEGQILTREEFERLCYTLAFWMIRAVDLDLKNIAPVCLGFSYVEEAYGVLDRFLIRDRFLAPFSQACSSDSQVSLPHWGYDAIKLAVDSFWETDGTDGADVETYGRFLERVKARKEAANA